MVQKSHSRSTNRWSDVSSIEERGGVTVRERLRDYSDIASEVAASLRECVDAAVATARIVRGRSEDQSRIAVVALRGIIRRLVIAERAASTNVTEKETVKAVAVGSVARECAADIIEGEAFIVIAVGLVCSERAASKIVVEAKALLHVVVGRIIGECAATHAAI